MFCYAIWIFPVAEKFNILLDTLALYSILIHNAIHSIFIFKTISSSCFVFHSIIAVENQVYHVKLIFLLLFDGIEQCYKCQFTYSDILVVIYLY